MGSQNVVRFPEGGRDFYKEESRLIASSSMEAYIKVAASCPELVVKLERVLRMEKEGYCLIPDKLEQQVFSFVGNLIV